LELVERPVLILVVAERHDRDEPPRNEEIGDGPVVAGSRGNRLAGLAGDVSSSGNDDVAGLFLSSPFCLEAAIVP
jgi:hypothetical protein